jgi:hypothetical protein
LPRAREADLPRPGDKAPDFELPLLARADNSEGKDTGPSKPPATAERKPASEPTVKLSSFAGKKPVALIFGSYT